MTTIVTRAGKGAALTHAEADANFTNLNADKVETAAIADMATKTGVEILTNKTIDLTSNTLSGTLSQFNSALSGDDFIAMSTLTSANGSSLIGFSPSGIGSTSTTVQTKLQEIIGAKDYGDTDGLGTITLNVPAQYGTIQAAFDYLADKVISSGTIVQIQVADGTYNLSSGISLNHPQASQIRLVGNEITPTNCIIQVSSGGFDCFVSNNGNSFGYLNGFKLYKTYKALAADNSTAILANNGATIICGNKIVVDNWYYGIAARNGSFIYAPSAQVDHAGDVGIWSFVGSTVYAPSAVSNNALDAANGWGFGFQAEYGSALDCSGGSATGCNVGGIASLTNSNVRALSCTASSNTGSGFYARDGGTIENHSSTANSNTRYGIEEIGSSRVIGSGVTTTSNVLGAKAPTVYFDNSTLGARLTANGDLRIDTNDTGNTYFNTSGGLQFVVTHSANAVNRLHVTGSATGTAPTLQAAGSDAIIDIAILPKGAGSFVKIGAGFTSTGDVASNGYIQIKDSTGTIRKLMTTA